MKHSCLNTNYLIPCPYEEYNKLSSESDPRPHAKKTPATSPPPTSIFAMALICRIGHDHQAPWVVLVLVLFQAVTRGEQKTTTWPIYLRLPILLQILDPLYMTNRGSNKKYPTPKSIF